MDAEGLDKLQRIIAHTYQLAGAHDAPEHILDVLANPLQATDEEVDAMRQYWQAGGHLTEAETAANRMGTGFGGGLLVAESGATK